MALDEAVSELQPGICASGEAKRSGMGMISPVQQRTPQAANDECPKEANPKNWPCRVEALGISNGAAQTPARDPNEVTSPNREKQCQHHFKERSEI